MKRISGIILTAARADNSLTQLFGDIPTGITPVNGKPIIFYIINNFIKNNITDIYIAVDYKKNSVMSVVNKFFEKKANIHYVEVNGEGLPGQSLLKTLKVVKNGRVIINLADTYVDLDDDLLKSKDAILTSIDFDRLKIWCAVKVDGERKIKDFIDKKETVKTDEEAIVGVYLLNNIETIVENFSEEYNCQISELLAHYIKVHDIAALKCKSWLDFGHIDKFQKSKKRMLEARNFNTLKFDDTLGLVTKTSRNKEKFVKEILWQLNLPPKIQVLFPRIIEYNVTDLHPYVTMEYYSYQTMSEIWLYSEFDVELLKSILDKIIKVHNLFYAEKRNVSMQAYERIYKNKTEIRVKELLNKQPLFSKLFEYPELKINGSVYLNWPVISEKIFDLCDQLYCEDHNCLIHGDYCFSNILYDVNSGVVRLIDPRGTWDENGNGDIKYDYAKIRHSIHGGYDFIVNDLFNINIEGNRIDYDFIGTKKNESIVKYFDESISDKVSNRQVVLIEGLLFLSMLPLHNNSLERQLIMYARALEIFNGII